MLEISQKNNIEFFIFAPSNGIHLFLNSADPLLMAATSCPKVQPPPEVDLESPEGHQVPHKGDGQHKDGDHGGPVDHPASLLLMKLGDNDDSPLGWS